MAVPDHRFRLRAKALRRTGRSAARQSFALSTASIFENQRRLKTKGARDIRDPSGSTDPSPLAERR
ncbi:MAG TPA: hypothetical protein VFB45_23230, partial [Pseudolabrys sp.]|nr:hypothetical protein [Pseudolabrys sp.]